MERMGWIDSDGLCEKIGRAEAHGRTQLVGIDGCGGAGKSSLAKQIGSTLEGVTVVAGDDFWLPGDRRPERAEVIADPGSDYDWERLRDQVVLPLSKDEPGRYQRYDWGSDSLMEWHDVPSIGTVIVEGVFCTRQELAPLYDVRVWVETPRAICLERGYARDGAAGRALWDEEWMPAYENYVKQSDPAGRAHYKVKGSGGSGEALSAQRMDDHGNS